MLNSFNAVIRIAQTPQEKQLQKYTMVTFNAVCNDRSYNRVTKLWEDNPLWLHCVSFAVRSVDRLLKLQKGDLIVARGYLTSNTYTSDIDGKTRTTVQFTIEDFQDIEWKKQNKAVVREASDVDVNLDDDLPF